MFRLFSFSPELSSVLKSPTTGVNLREGSSGDSSSPETPPLLLRQESGSVRLQLVNEEWEFTASLSLSQTAYL